MYTSRVLLQRRRSHDNRSTWILGLGVPLYVIRFGSTAVIGNKCSVDKAPFGHSENGGTSRRNSRLIFYVIASYIWKSVWSHRPGQKGAYDYLHAGGANTLRTYGLRPDFYAHHEVLTTLEYRWEFFERSPFEVFGSNLYYGLQWVFGTDTAMQWRTADGKPVFLHSVYMGPHLLFPGIDRLRIEFGINHLGHGIDRVAFGINMGLFDKSFMQRQRIR